jgi:hypothetical protein
MAFTAPRFRFGPPASEPGKGCVVPALSVKDVARRTAMLREAKDVLPHLPARGEALHALLTGRYDLMVLITAVLERRPDVCAHLRLATLSLKQRNSYELLTLTPTPGGWTTGAASSWAPCSTNGTSRSIRAGPTTWFALTSCPTSCKVSSAS